MSLENPNRERLSEFQTEKLFWKKVAEEIKETDFRRIYKTIFPDIESGNYALARQAFKEELRKVVAEKSPTMYSNTDQRGSALIILKEEFYKLFPELEFLIEETEEEKRAKIKISTGQLGKSDDEMPPPSEGEFREGFREQYLVEDLDWEIPKRDEFIPGLTIIFKDRMAQLKETIEFIDIPHLRPDGDFDVKVKWNDQEGLIKLADFGLLAYSGTGLWNSRYIPEHWEIKKKK